MPLCVTVTAPQKPCPYSSSPTQGEDLSTSLPKARGVQGVKLCDSSWWQLCWLPRSCSDSSCVCALISLPSHLHPPPPASPPFPPAQPSPALPLQQRGLCPFIIYCNSALQVSGHCQGAPLSFPCSAVLRCPSREPSQPCCVCTLC